ncbi:hypothetical protein MUU74_11320 [Chryseobacterium daecheongense]|uniref:hypothetical protein n=1 Tax=Chryseobacterium daecheongense TaxID=192389 RepID=UPI001FD6328A|nr:hypothetical protein [Chryseobacterium daecheongense]UOU97083.1 hypothetical protein MUU74_11320 [Chryseobacterium daecheongense]
MKRLLLLGSLLFSVDAFSQVGINTSTPQKTLHVNGSLQITNELNVEGNASTAGSAGTSGQILPSDGPGVAPSWTNINSVSGTIASVIYLNRTNILSKI